MVALARGEALLALGDVDGAEAVLSASPSEAEGGFYYDRDAHAVVLAIAKAEVAHRRGDHSGAVKGLEQVCTAFPDSPQAALARLHALVRADRADEALREGVAYMRAHPTDRGGLLLCATAAEALGMSERAQRWREKALA
jgi:thioredoxin-like negative regulator of GroEL